MCNTLTKRDILMSALTVCVTLAVLHNSSMLMTTQMNYSSHQLRARSNHLQSSGAILKAVTDTRYQDDSNILEKDDDDILPELLDLIKRKTKQNQP